MNNNVTMKLQAHTQTIHSPMVRIKKNKANTTQKKRIVPTVIPVQK